MEAAEGQVQKSVSELKHEQNGTRPGAKRTEAMLGFALAIFAGRAAGFEGSRMILRPLRLLLKWESTIWT